MAETRDNNDKTDDASTEAKNCCCNCRCNITTNDKNHEKTQNRASYYQVLLDHAISSGRDLDKQFIALSALGIGFIAILANDAECLLLSLFSIIGYVGFLVSIISSLLSINKSPDFLNKKLDEQEEPNNERLKEDINEIYQYLTKKEKGQTCGFIIGTTFTILLILLSFIVKFILPYIRRLLDGTEIMECIILMTA